MKYTQDKKQSWRVQLLAGQKGLCTKGKVACGSQPTKPLKEVSSIASLKLALIFPPVKSGQGIRLFLRFAETESISSLRRLRTVWCEMQGSKVGRIWAPKANVSLTTETLPFALTVSLRKFSFLNFMGDTLLSSTQKLPPFSPANQAFVAEQPVEIPDFKGGRPFLIPKRWLIIQINWSP